MSDVLLSFGVQNAKADASKMISDLEAAFSNSDPVKIKVGLKVDKSALNTFKSQLSQIVNSISLSNGAPITVKIDGLGDISSQTGNVKKAIDGVSDSAKKASKSLNEMTTSQQRSSIEKLNTLLIKVKTNSKEWAAAADINGGTAYKNYTDQIAAIEELRKNVEDGTVSVSEFADRFSEIKANVASAAAEIQSFDLAKLANDQKKLTVGTKEYQTAVQKVVNLLATLKAHLASWTSAKTGTSSADYKELEGYVHTLEALWQRMRTGEVTQQEFANSFGNVSAGAKAAEGNIRAAGEATMSLGDRIKNAASKFGVFLSVTQVIQTTIKVIKKMVNEVVEIDSAMTELKKVTDETDYAYSKFLDNAASRAKEVGASLTDVISATASYARLGNSISDASTLADASIVYKNVADGISSIDEASGSIISTMQAFGVEAEDVMSIVDKFNNVSNKYAISSGGIGEALQKSAAAMHAAGNTLDETIALITAANTTVQNPETVGTTLKTVSMYLRAAKTEAESAGESTDGMANSVSELRDEILKLTGNAVDIQIDENRFKSTYQILKEIAGVWDNLSDISQANLLEMLGGKRNANVLSALLGDFDLAEDVLRDSMESAGSALAENEKYLDSIAGKMNQFKASFEALSNTVVNSDLVKVIIDAGTTIMDILNGILDLTGSIVPLLSGGAIYAFIKNLDSLNNLGKFSNVVEIFKQMDKANPVFGGDEYKKTAQSILGSLDLSKAIEGLKSVNIEGDELAKTLNKMGFSAEEISKALGDVGSEGAKNATLIGKMKSGYQGLAASIGVSTTALTAFLGVAAGLFVIYQGWKLYNEYIDECVDKADSAATALSEQNKALDEQKQKVNELRTALDSGNLSDKEAYENKSELVSIQKSLIDTYGEQAAGIDLVNGKLEEQLALLDQISVAQANTWLNENKTGISKAVEEIEKIRRISLFTEYTGTSDLEKKVREIAEKYSDYLSYETTGGIANQTSLVFKGTAEEAKQVLNDFATDLRAIEGDFDNSVFGSAGNGIHNMLTTIESELGRVNTVLSTYQNTYDSYRQYTLMTDQNGYSYDGTSRSAAEWLNDYSVAVQNYNDALAGGDTSKIEAAASEFAAIDTAIKALTGEGGSMSQYAQDVANIANQLDTASVAANNFHDRLTMDQPEIAGGNRLKWYAEKLQELGLTDVDLQSFVSNPDSTEDGAAAFRALSAAADEYGISVNALIPLLVKWGYVQGQVTTTAEENNGVLYQSYEALSEATSNATVAQRAASEVFADNTYLTKDSYEAIVELVGAEGDLGECIDTTNGYLVTNAAALNKLVSASSKAVLKNVRLASSHEKLNYHKLTAQLKDVVSGMEQYDSATMDTVKTLLSQIDATELQIAKYAMLEQQLLGVTNAFTEFANAQEIDSASDYTDDLSSMISSLIGSFENHEFGTETFWTTFKSLIPDDVYESFEDIGDQIDAGWDYLNTKLAKYFTYDGGNVSIDFDNVKAFVEDGLATAFAEDENVFVGTLDSFELNPQITSIEQLADAMGITTTAAFALGNAISKYTADNADFLSSLSIDSLEGQIYAADQELVELLAHKAQLMESGEVGTSDWYETVAAINDANTALDEIATKAREDIHDNIRIDSNILEQQQIVDDLYTKLSSMDETNVDYSATFNDYVKATGVLADLVNQKNELEEPTELTVEVAVEQIQSEIDSVETTLSSLATFDGTTYTAKVSANQSEVDALVEKLNSLNGEKAEIEVYAGIDDADVLNSLETIENFTVDDKEFSVTADLGDTLSRLSSVQSALAAIKSKTVYVNTVYTSSGSSSKSSSSMPSRAYGTARYLGTAHERGTWGTRSPEKNALVGELGEELWVDPNTGTYQTVGENGAEFIDLPRGAIVFNHKQTEGLLKNRRINSRGIAYVSGNAHYTMLDGRYSFGGGGSSGGSSGSSGSSSGSSSSSSSSSDAKTWFEEAYAYHQHLLAMDQESMDDYLRWLEGAYQQAYAEGIIDLEEMYKYEEECYEKSKEIFDDYLNDIEFKIEGLSRQEGTASQIVNIYLSAIQDINRKIAEARARGLNDNDDYIQELIKKLYEYEDAIEDIRDDATDNAKNAVDDLIQYRIKMLKQDLQNEKDALEDKKSALKDFYNEQKQMLQDVYDEEKTQEEREEKRKAKSDIEAELAQLEFDDSAWAQKRKLELQKELADAQKDLDDFEKEQTLNNTQDMLDDMYEKQAEQIQTEIDAIEEALNNPEALYNQALRDIQNNTQALFEEMVQYNARYGDGDPSTVKEMWDEAKKSLDDFFETFGRAYKDIILVDSPSGYASGTPNATRGIHEVDEKGSEWLFTSGDGTKYRVFSGGEKVLDANATNFLYNFATTGGKILSDAFSSLLNAIMPNRISNQQRPLQISTGDIIIQGNANEKTVSEIRRAQRDNVEYILKEFTKLNK